jgi:hypothetical protein
MNAIVSSVRTPDSRVQRESNGLLHAPGRPSVSIRVPFRGVVGTHGAESYVRNESLHIHISGTAVRGGPITYRTGDTS